MSDVRLLCNRTIHAGFKEIKGSSTVQLVSIDDDGIKNLRKVKCAPLECSGVFVCGSVGKLIAVLHQLCTKTVLYAAEEGLCGRNVLQSVVD